MKRDYVRIYAAMHPEFPTTLLAGIDAPENEYRSQVDRLLESHRAELSYRIHEHGRSDLTDHLLQRITFSLSAEVRNLLEDAGLLDEVPIKTLTEIPEDVRLKKGFTRA